MKDKKTFKLFIFLIFTIGLCMPLLLQAAEVDQEFPYVNKIVFSKDVEENEPLLETDTFYLWDEKVVCWVSFNYNSDVPFVISWEWTDPEGKIYHIGKIEMESGNYRNYRTWYWITISDHNAANLPGEWKATFFINDVLSAEKKFVIE